MDSKRSPGCSKLSYLNDFWKKTNSVVAYLRLAEVDGSRNYVKFLNVLIDEKLSWNPHVDHLAKRLSRVLISRQTNSISASYVLNA